METLTDTDLNYCVRRLPKDVRALMQGQRLFMGGGFIRETIAGGEPKDIDFFGGNKESLSLMARLLAEKRQGSVHVTDNAITLLAPPRMPMQQNRTAKFTGFSLADQQVMVILPQAGGDNFSAIGAEWNQTLARRFGTGCCTWNVRGTAPP